MAKVPSYRSTVIAKVPCRPYTESWITAVLAPFASHYEALMGHPALNPDEVLTAARSQLLELVMPFARLEYSRRVRNLPKHADVNTLESAINEATMRACQSFEPTTYISWPALLKAKIVRAPAEAARTDSKISRRHAKLGAAFAVAEDHQVQLLGRALTPPERQALAERVAPATRREDWPTVVQYDVRTSQIESLVDEGQDPKEHESMTDLEMRVACDEMLAELSDTLERTDPAKQALFCEELARIREGKAPRDEVILELRGCLPPDMQSFFG